jgi:alginate O-acetyltransferase complex protein AlgJ
MKIFTKISEKIKESESGFSAVTAILFLTILIGGVYLIFAPKQEFSEDENRMLESTPRISLVAVRDGTFMDSIENYVGDHFMLRKAFISLNTRVQLLMGKRDLGSNYSSTPAEGGVYFGADDHIYEVLLPDRSGIFRNNIAALNCFADKTGLPLYIEAVPSGSQEQPDKLPLFAPNHDQREEINEIKSTAGKNTKVIDLFDTLSDKTGQDYYFKTDHHWNIWGAYEGYRSLVGAMGLEAVSKEDFNFKPVSNEFYGTLYSKAILPEQQPDVFYLPEYKKKANITQQTGKQVRNSLYWEEYLQKKDKYSTFLGGNHSVDVVKNADAKNGKKLLILKDSYANSMIPFLALNFSEIHIIDLRYYNQDVYSYIDQNGITDTAAIYSIKQLCEVSISNKLIARK